MKLEGNVHFVQLNDTLLMLNTLITFLHRYVHEGKITVLVKILLNVINLNNNS